MAHEWLERYIKAMLPGAITDCMVRPLPAEKRAASCVEAALAWFAKHKFEPIFSEKKLYSRRYGYAGTCDWLAYVTSCGDPECCPFLGEALVLGDFKSSNNLYDEYFCQLASYRQAIEEEWPELQIGACTLLRLGKEDGEFEVRTSTQEEFDSDFDGFLGCLSMYHWQKQRSLNKRYERETAKAEAKAAKAEALAQVPGKVLVTGHTDNQPIRTVRFPSNWHLSDERANAVRAILVSRNVAAERINAEGRADGEPVVVNDTPANRARNRRVEITLMASRTGAAT